MPHDTYSPKTSKDFIHLLPIQKAPFFKFIFLINAELNHCYFLPYVILNPAWILVKVSYVTYCANTGGSAFSTGFQEVPEFYSGHR